ncbi:hypothetical protein [Halospeciosus flavus]|uniref:Uncharacterized protein n=2 Tax=Halospeciosus flavus TaxID=3032283 RepID=A0ABD5Z8E5_9EURY|nr:hypothetical protein [Halospeciosus flavus]
MFDHDNLREPDETALGECIAGGNHRTEEIARELGIPKQQAVDRLRDLQQRGRVETATSGNALTWWLDDEG